MRQVLEFWSVKEQLGQPEYFGPTQMGTWPYRHCDRGWGTKIPSHAPGPSTQGINGSPLEVRHSAFDSSHHPALVSANKEEPIRLLSQDTFINNLVA
jgi:hypothetical protein